MYHLATMHSVTDRRTGGQTDWTVNIIMRTADPKQLILLHAVRSAKTFN